MKEGSDASILTLKATEIEVDNLPSEKLNLQRLLHCCAVRNVNGST